MLRSAASARCLCAPAQRWSLSFCKLCKSPVIIPLMFNLTAECLRCCYLRCLAKFGARLCLLLSSQFGCFLRAELFLSWRAAPQTYRILSSIPLSLSPPPLSLPSPPPPPSGYIGEVEIIDDRRAGKVVVNLIGRLNKCGVISPRFDVGLNDIEKWTNNLLPSRQFGKLVLTTSAGLPLCPPLLPFLYHYTLHRTLLLT
jgi:hypothetical protein